MCRCCCKTETRQFCVFGCGVFILLVALIVGLLWPTLALNLIYSRLMLEEGSLNYENWVETPIPMYMEITMFNWTNSADVRVEGVKPLLTEMGPYVFQESHKRTNVTWNENGTVTFNQIRTWQFRADMSGGSLDDEITNLNMVSATVGYELRYESTIVKIGANLLLNSRGGSLFVTKTVRELLFEGYEDPFLDFLREANSTAFNVPDFDKFGWFYGRNDSWSYDGTFNMNTGQTDITEMGFLNLWNGEPTTGFYSDGCSEINGTTGELWPPQLDVNEDITLFISDLCRSVSLAPDGVGINKFGIDGGRWIGDDRVFDNGVNYPPNQCFCTADECPDMPSGVFNVSECRFGAPVFMSYPHFYLGDRSYVDAVDGINPIKEKHEFSIAIEPSTGIPLEARARMQVNVLLQPISRIDIYENVPHVLVPMLWFTQSATLEEDLAGQAKLAITLPSVGVYAAYGFAALGAILLIIGITLTLTNRWHTHNRLIEDSDH